MSSSPLPPSSLSYHHHHYHTTIITIITFIDTLQLAQRRKRAARNIDSSLILDPSHPLWEKGRESKTEVDCSLVEVGISFLLLDRHMGKRDRDRERVMRNRMSFPCVCREWERERERDREGDRMLLRSRHPRSALQTGTIEREEEKYTERLVSRNIESDRDGCTDRQIDRDIS